MSNPIVVATFECLIKKVQTLKGGDGAFRITLDIPQSEKEQVKNMMDIDLDTETVYIAMSRIERDPETETEQEPTKPVRTPKPPRQGIY